MPVTLKKIDLKKEMGQLYNPTAKAVAELEVPRANYLMIDGQGDPNRSEQYRDAVEALFSVSYALKFAVKKTENIDYGVMPLEGLWWPSAGEAFDIGNKNSWNWTALILQPEYVTPQRFEQILPEVAKKKSLPSLHHLRLECLSEGKSLQILHLGPYSAEAPTIARLHTHAQANGYTYNGKHHEIYLNDPARTAPEKLKTILRQPVR